MALPASGLSFHLSTLEQAGLITAERNGRHVFYRANPVRLGGLLDFLMNDCCGADPEITRCCRT